MEKDNYRDYAVEAFRYYSQCGKPSRIAIHHAIPVDSRHNAAAVSDLEAVANTIDAIRRTEIDASVWIRCLDIVYFTEPKRRPARNEISQRVAFACAELNVSESSVYRILKKARQIFAYERGLRTEETCADIPCAMRNTTVGRRGN